MKRLTLHLDLTAVMVVIAAGVLLPVLLATAVGIVTLVIARDAGNIITGVLVISFAVTALGSALVTVVLTGRKMRLARRQADFIAGMSHELRTPLSAIRLYTQTLQSGKLEHDPERVAECLETIRRETEWLDVMLDRVLTWRAASRGGLPMELVTRPVDGAVRDALTRFQSMVPPEGMTLKSQIGTTTPVRHDVRALHGIVLNILTNAYKYSGDDKQITLATQETPDGVDIKIGDNGVGLTRTQMKRIFLPFYRVRTSDGVKSSGSGLGLSIARHHVLQQDGDIRVDSVPGQGSIFTIHLPCAAEGAV